MDTSDKLIRDFKNQLLLWEGQIDDLQTSEREEKHTSSYHKRLYLIKGRIGGFETALHMLGVLEEVEHTHL